tara:strand:+ start:307 stop:459 length:153 start_codon:yes stop_codon:yes gene_type:complete
MDSTIKLMSNLQKKLDDKNKKTKKKKQSQIFYKPSGYKNINTSEIKKKTK